MTSGAEVAFFDEVGERQPAVHVVLADRDDQSQVRLNHAILRLVVVVVDDPPAEMLLLLGGEKIHFVDLLEIQLQVGLKA